MTNEIEKMNKDLTASFARMEAEHAKRRSFFEMGDHNYFGEFAKDERLPLMFPDAWRRTMTPMSMVLLPETEVREMLDGGRKEWSPAIAALLSQHLDEPKVVRFGGRTAHDCGVVVATDVEDVRQMMNGSERAIVEAWAWCPRRGYLPVTFHDVFDHDFEFRVQVSGGKVVSASNSMWGSEDPDSPQPFVVAWNRIANSVRGMATMFEERVWLDIGYGSYGVRLYDVNPDDGSSWPGWHPERTDDGTVPRSLVVNHDGATMRYGFMGDSILADAEGTVVER